MINELIFYEEPFDYFTEASKQVGYDVSQSAVMVGGLPCFHYPVALIPDDSGTVSGLVPVVAPIMVPDGLAKKYASGNYYDFREAKVAVEQQLTNDGGDIIGIGGGSGRGRVILPTGSCPYSFLVSLYWVFSLPGILSEKRRSINPITKFVIKAIL